jgi:DnaJ-class molecular chaperone
MRGYAAAQREWENREPPSGPCECQECDGTGINKLVRGDRNDNCPCCDGTGRLDEYGEPFFSYEYEGD